MVALKNVHLKVGAGESLALVGKNGAGKSTLLLVFAGIRRPTAGSVKINGSVGVVPERPPLYERLSPRQSLEFYGAMHGMPADQVKARTYELFERLAMGSNADSRIRTLSAGWRQRVALAQALLHSPDLLLLDEPLGGLDPESSELILRILDEERERGATLVVATHRLADFARVCDRVSLMSGGSLRSLGPMDSVLTHLPARITYTLPARSTPPSRVKHIPGPMLACLASAGQREAAVAHIQEQGGSIVRVEPDVTGLSQESADVEETLA